MNEMANLCKFSSLYYAMLDGEKILLYTYIHVAHYFSRREETSVSKAENEWKVWGIDNPSILLSFYSQLELKPARNSSATFDGPLLSLSLSLSLTLSLTDSQNLSKSLEEKLLYWEKVITASFFYLAYWIQYCPQHSPVGQSSRMLCR